MIRPETKTGTACLPGLILALVLAAGTGDLAAAKAPKTYRILAGPYSSQPIAPPFPPAVTATQLKGLNVSVEYLEPEARAAFVAAALPGQPDLFAGGSIGPDSFRAFRVRIANGAAEDLALQPGNIVLVTDKGEQQFPIDLTDLYRLALHAKAGDPDGMVRGVTRVMFDGSTLVRAGGTLERLIVFGAMPEKWREFRVVFSFLQIGAETHSLTFLFHRRPVAG